VEPTGPVQACNGVALALPLYISNKMQRYSLFYLETALHVSGGTTTYHQERKQLYLQQMDLEVILRQIFCSTGITV